MNGFLNEALRLHKININFNTWFQKVIIKIPPCLVDFYLLKHEHEHALPQSIQPYPSLQIQGSTAFL